MKKRSSIIFLFSGILLIIYLSSPGQILTVIIASSFVASAGIVLFHLKSAKLKTTGLKWVALALGLLWGNSLLFRLDLFQNKFFRGYGDTDSFSGILLTDSLPAKDKSFIHTLKIGKIISMKKNYTANASGVVKVIEKKGKKYYTGQQLQVMGKLRRSEGEKDIHYLCFTNSPLESGGYVSLLFKWRANLLKTLKKSIAKMGVSPGALFQALFLGAKEDLTGELKDRFQKTGTLHILALSGLHVGIIYLLITLILLPLPGRWWKWTAGVVVVLLYLFLVGPRPSLLRASVMILLFGFLKLTDREAKPLDILALAGLIILTVDPAAAYTLSFQLSFLALLGIILIGNKVYEKCIPFMPRFLAGALGCSLGAQAATAPVILAGFGVIYPSGIIVTLLLTPFITLFIWAGIVMMVVNLFNVPLLSGAGAYFMQGIYNIILIITGVFNKIPGIYTGKYPALLFFLVLFIPLVFIDLNKIKIFKKQKNN